jgi:ribonuclease D
MSHGQVERYGHAILQAIQRGWHAKTPPRPDHNQRMDTVTMARYEALRDWRKTRAAERGVESDVIIPKEALWALARTPPRTAADLDGVPGLGPWKREQYGAELIKLLAHITQDSADSARLDG